MKIKIRNYVNINNFQFFQLGFKFCFKYITQLSREIDKRVFAIDIPNERFAAESLSI